MIRLRWWLTPALAVGLAYLLAGPAAPVRAALSTETPPDGAEAAPAKTANTVTLKLQDTPLSAAISYLATQADVIIANNDGLKGKTVTVNLKEKTIDQALDLILTSNDIPWYRDEDGTYVVNAKRPVSEAAPNVSTADLLPPAPAPASPRRFVSTEKIKLFNISPEECMRALGLPDVGVDWRGKTNGNPYQIGSYVAPGTPLELQNPLPGGLTPANPASLITPAEEKPKADAGPSRMDLTTPIISPSALDAANDGFNRAPGDRDEFGQLTTPGAGRRPGFTPRSQVPTPPTTPGTPGAGGTAGTPGTAGGVAGQAGRGFVPEGIDLVAGLLSDNSVLVQGDPDAIAELQNVIRLLDIAPQQVSIKVDVITVSTSVLRQFGTQWQFFTSQSNIRAQTGTVPDGLTVDIVRGNVQALIGSLTTNGRGRVIASPIVTTMNNFPANIQQGSQVPVFLPVIQATVGGTISQTVVVPVSAQTGLFVTPRINRDGTITMTGTVNVTNIVRIVSSPDGTTVAPETNFTNLGPFIRRVASGETLVIGGLNQKTDTEEETRIPLLSEIPFVGNLFRSRRRDNRETQLLMFITPSIVGERANPEDATTSS